MADRSITQRPIRNALSETSHHQAIPEKVNSWIGGEGIGREGGRPSFQDFEEHLLQASSVLPVQILQMS